MAVATKTKPAAAKAKAAAPDVIAKTVNEISNLTKAKAIKMVPELEDGNAFNDFKLGGVLAAIQEQGWWEGEASFRDFLKAQFGIDPTKAYVLIKTYINLVDAEVPWDSVKSVRWTKLDIISPVINPENVEEWVLRASELTSLQLREYVKNYLAGQDSSGAPDETEAPANDVSTLTFKVHEDQKETIKNAVEQVKDANDTEFDAVALEWMALQYLEGALGKPKKAPQQSMKTQMKKAGFEKARDELAELYPEQWEELSTTLGAEQIDQPVNVTGLMEEMGVEGVLEVFEQVFPSVNLTAELSD